MVGIVRKSPEKKNVQEALVTMESGERMWGCEGVFAFFDSETSKKRSQGDADRRLELTGHILRDHDGSPHYLGVVRFGAAWKYFLLHSCNQGRFILKSSLLTGVCAGYDSRTMIVN